MLASFEEATGMSQSDIENVISNAAHSKRAIVFVYVGWAPMRPQLDRFAELAIRWSEVYPATPIGFHFVDFTNGPSHYQPLTSLPGWPTRDGRPYPGRLGGYGELIWICDGRIAHIQTALDFPTIDPLVNLTSSLFTPQTGK